MTYPRLGSNRLLQWGVFSVSVVKKTSISFWNNDGRRFFVCSVDFVLNFLLFR